MTTISRTRFEYLTKAMAEGIMAGPRRINRENEVKIGKRVDATAEEKAFLAKSQATAAAAEADAEAFQREFGPRADTALSPATYTKWGKISTEEEKAAFVQWKLDQFDAGEAFNAKYQQRLEIENSTTAVSTTGQSGNANLSGTSLAKYHRYEENHEMYLPNISDLSLENAQKSLGIAQVMIKNHEDAGLNIHGRYSDQAISDLNAYVAALKDYISKIEVGVSLTPSEATKGTTSNGG